MKRWESIKTEKKQLGGIIKLLKKVSPKLASKAKGRLLVSRLRQVKDLKTPYIFPGQLGWSPAETRTVWHRTNNPNFKVKRVFEGRWDAKEHGAPKNGLWVSEKKDIGFMNDRPILIQLQQILKKPMVQIGDIPAKALNVRLEIDPNKFTTLMNKLQTKYGMSEADARHWIGNRVKYWQTPQESRARAGAVNQYKRNHPNASEEELTQIDNARQIFTNESLNNLYGKTIALGILVALASSQLGNGE